MPQMAPLNWMMIFFLIIIMTMLMNSINYFMFLYNPPLKKSKLTKKKNWKW